jgi:hypothetical protein
MKFTLQIVSRFVATQMLESMIQTPPLMRAEPPTWQRRFMTVRTQSPVAEVDTLMAELRAAAARLHLDGDRCLAPEQFGVLHQQPLEDEGTEGNLALRLPGPVETEDGDRLANNLVDDAGLALATLDGGLLGREVTSKAKKRVENRKQA